jgi:electron transfer flavoprotein beta subunit
MKIVVCLKLVPETDADLRPAPDGRSALLTNVQMVINPYDEYALEVALRLRETCAGSSILALTVGGDEARKCVQQAFALGVESGLHILAPEADAAAAARVAARALARESPDLILTGRQACDDDLWLFPGMLAELLDLPHVTAVNALEVLPDAKTLRAKRRFDNEEQTLEASLPAVVSCDRGVGELRVPKLIQRLASKRKSPQVLTPEALGLSASELAPVRHLDAMGKMERRGKLRMLPSVPAEAAAQLVRLLREEAKVL